MNKIYFIVIPTILSFMIIACRTDDDCVGCNKDMTLREYEFKMEGHIHSDCAGQPAANRTIEMTLFYKEDTIEATGQTDVSGYFSFWYKLLLPVSYSQTTILESYCLLNVKEDTVTFYLSDLDHHRDLDLQIGDSLDINFYVDFINNPLKESDTIYYRFAPPKMAGSTFNYKVGGPLDDHALINTLKDKWRIVELDQDDSPVFHFRMYIVRGDGGNSSYGFLPYESKEPCIMNHQDLVILLN